MLKTPQHRLLTVLIFTNEARGQYDIGALADCIVALLH